MRREHYSLLFTILGSTYSFNAYALASAGAPVSQPSKYRTLRITGTALWVTGLTILVTELVMLGSESNLIVNKDSRGQVTAIKPLYWGMFVPGALLGISGAVMIQGANGYMFDAIEQYNADLTLQLRGRPANGTVNYGHEQSSMNRFSKMKYALCSSPFRPAASRPSRR